MSTPRSGRGHPDAPSGGEVEGDRVDFYPEQVKRLYAFLRLALLANVINSVILAAVLWTSLSHERLIVWMAGVLLLTAVRLLLIRRYNAAPGAEKRGRKWGRLLIGGNFLSGLLWGSLPVFLFPSDSMPHQVFEAFVIGGMVAGAVSTFSDLKLAFAAYAAPALFPLTFRFFMFADRMHIAMATMCSIYILLMFMSSFRNHNAYRTVLELNVENQRLIERLAEKSGKAEQMTEELRNLTAYLDRVREEESKRMATEIHDQLGQSLTATKMALARMRNSWPDAPEEVRAGFFSVSALVETVISDVRRIARHLRPLVLDELGLGAAVDWLVDDFRERTSAVCDLEVAIDDERLEPDSSMMLFRIVQEALTNVARHAEARHVRVSLVERGDDILLRVEDDGKGISPDFSRSHAFGILSMKERARRLKGELQIFPAEPTGTVVSLQIPKGRREA